MNGENNEMKISIEKPWHRKSSAKWRNGNKWRKSASK